MRNVRRGRRKTLPKVIVAVEGEVTEDEYITGIRQARRVQRERVVVHPACGVPLSVVKVAVEAKIENDAKNRAEGIVVKDEVWAVFDRDDHPNIPEAKALAKQHGVKIAFSNPCFELFLLYHFENLDRDEHRDTVTRLLKRHIPGYVKHISYLEHRFDENYPEAKVRSDKTTRSATVLNGIECPPYCSITGLIDRLRRMTP